MGKEDKEALPVYVDSKSHHHRRHAAKKICVFLLATLLLALFLLGLAALIIWLVLRPIHSPTWTVEDIQVVTLNVQTKAGGRRLAEAYQKNNLQNPLVNADIFLTFNATNRNKHIDFIYDSITVKLAFATYTIGRMSLSPFRQGKNNVTTLETEIKAMSVPVNSNLGSALQGDINNDSILFQVYVDARARAKIGEYKSFQFGVQTTCDIGATAPSSGRAGQLLTRNCHKY